MLTKATKRYIESPPENWNEISKPTKQYYRNIEARIRKQVSNDITGIFILCTSFTPLQLERIFTQANIDELAYIDDAISRMVSLKRERDELNHKYAQRMPKP